MLKYINGVPNAPKVVGPYSQAVVWEKMAYLSGQIPIHPETGQLVDGDIEAQTDQVMKNILAVLGHLNIDFSNVLKTTIFLTDLSNFQKVNAIYAKWVGSVAPARSTIQVAALPLGSQVEIEVVAALSSELRDELPHGTMQDVEGFEGQIYSASGVAESCKTGRASCKIK